MIEQLESRITAVAARCLGPGVRVDGSTSFELLGLDSLATIELAAALEVELGCDLPADVLAECTDARTLAARIMREGIPTRHRDDPFEQMFADAVLPEDVRPVGRVARSTDLRSARRILLTGSTGFLGRALLEELLRTTQATIVCLVRPRGVPKAGDREIRRSGDDRIELIEGDLTHVGLGLSDTRYNELAEGVDAILHCGAAVNWVFAYSALRAPNVFGTLELLRLACRVRAPFHFISSLSVCYSTEGPRIADETFDSLKTLRGIHLGYAQTKVVAESLVRQAGERGLPVRIYRPALISGHSDTGAFNRDDLISALTRGCIEMRTAPDLDWNLDAEPVDVVASAIVRLSRARGPVFHLGHERPRHWRECVLWMRMYGYDVRLLPYHDWLRQLEHETRPGDENRGSHALRPLRTFFLDRPSGGRGLTLPELYEERRRTRAAGRSTRALLRRSAHRDVPLDASLLERYFRAFRGAGDLPDPPCNAHDSEPVRSPLVLDAAFLSKLLGRRVTSAEILDTGSDHSIVSELTAWRSQRMTGLFRVRVVDDSGNTRVLMLKAKAQDTDIVAVGEALADLVEPEVGKQYRRFSDRIGFASSHLRETAIYRQLDPRFLRHAPALVGSIVDDTSQTWIAAIEYIDDAIVWDSGAAAPWREAHIARALDGLAALHAVWLGREAELQQQPWIGTVQSAESMVEMSPLWAALADHAAPLFSSWADRDMTAIHRLLISRLAEWWPAVDRGPRTLIHNDFNPRNVCLRGPNATLCAYDWELATIGLPQRDLAEFLCFVLPPDAKRETVLKWIDHFRSALERESGGQIDADQWLAGFRSALYDVLINRFSIYTIVHRVRRQPFLPRIVRTWRNLYQTFPLDRAV